MSVDALVEAMPVAVGRRVREARTDRGWTLDHLAARSAVSRRMIVNVEAGTTNASIATLLRLATALGVTLADLVVDAVDSAGGATVTSGHSPLWRGEAGGSAVMVASADTPDMLELWDWSMEPGERYASEPHRRGAWELLHVRSGTLEVAVNGTTHTLRSGDGLSFAADVPHTYANPNRRAVRFSMTVLEPVAHVR